MLKMPDDIHRAVGLVTEYNPFHNGHLHHLQESRQVADAEIAVAVMSGHFLQRGEPALVDKWVRTEMALRAGVDLVVELPFPWACNSAPYFALGAVQALNAFGGIDALCFGSEAGELAPLQTCTEMLLARADEFAEGTEELLRRGMNYPEARARVFQALCGEDSVIAALATPNNILGIEYLKALRVTRSAIEPYTVPRLGAGYHDTGPREDRIASATGIRRMIAEDEDFIHYIPDAVRPPFLEALAQERRLDTDALHRLLLAQIYRGPEYLRRLYQVENGIENRLLAAADVSTGYEALVDEAKSRQLTRTRIQRILSYVLNDVTSDDMAAFLETGPLYLHVLGASERGRTFLGACRQRRGLPLVANFSRIHAALKRHYGDGTEKQRLALRMLDYSLRATRIYTLLMRSWGEGRRNRDFYEEERFVRGYERASDV